MDIVKVADAHSRINAGIPSRLIVVGANTGGPQALSHFIAQFPETYTGSLVIQQRMRLGFTRVLVERFQETSNIKIEEPVDGQMMMPGTAYIAPGNTIVRFERIDMGVGSPFRLLLDETEAVNDSVSNVVDPTMQSASEIFRGYTIGVLLSGLGTDGVQGMKSIKENGGVTFVQDEATSVVFDLPNSAMHAGYATEILPVWHIAERIVSMTSEVSNANAA